MRISLFPASSLLFLVGCFDVVTVVPPEPPAEVIRLESGSYGLVVTDVLSADCDGQDEGDLFGLLLSMELSMGHGKGASANLQGIHLTGGMANGVLELDGELDVYTEESKPAEPCDEPDGGDDDGDHDRDRDTDEDVETTASEGGEVVETETDEHGEEPVDCGDADEPSHNDVKERRGELSLDIVASRPDHGEGVLRFADRICSFELVVEVQAVEQEDEVFHYDEEPECGEAVEEEVSDCG